MFRGRLEGFAYSIVRRAASSLESVIVFSRMSHCIRRDGKETFGDWSSLDHELHYAETE
jgi:hypothetical protein